MKKKPFAQGGASDLDKTIKKLSHKKDAPKFVFAIILVLYLLASIALRKVASDLSMVFLFGDRIPIQAFAGVFSSISNVCLIFLAVFFGRAGFFTSIAILVVQFPMMIVGLFIAHNLTAIPGFFSNTFAIITCVIIYINNTRIERYQTRLRSQAVMDRLTGLPNRYACAEMAEKFISKSVKFAVVSIDLDNFKGINDTMGHETGDQVIVEIANRWKALADSRRTNTREFLARLSGDDFYLIVWNYRSSQDILDTINCYKAELERKITINGCDYFMTAGFGYAEFPEDADSSVSILACASTAMHEAKRRGGEKSVVRFSVNHLRTAKNLELERKIRAALDNDLIFFQLQPQFDTSRKLRGFEALARMKDADGSLISPADFIPVAEKMGLVDKIDALVFSKAAKFLAGLMANTGKGIILCINVSVRHLMKNNFVEELKGIIASTGILPNNLEIDITESIMIESAEKALECIRQVKEMGVNVAIDDFGTGYSSLSYLNKFPADILKIDKSFIDVMNTSEASKKYVATIISLGHLLNLKVVAEGVETADQLETLESIGCDYIQGFLWGRPLSPEDAAQLL
ncbi:MAG: EAL domain-containing protein [Treponema sp.]|nr:EAL domain-containing protein [Treponema sp.]